MVQTPLLVIGHNGQLATSLRHAAKEKSIPLLALGRASLDLECATKAEISALLDKIKPWALINTAAYTQVDLAENDKETAKKINQTGVKHLTEVCAERDIPFIHISTDYVFDGTKGSPYVESDPVKPLGIYGATKEAGEQAALKYNKAIILRTSWVYSPYGKNFVKTILKAAETRPSLKVVNDQKGNPTSAPALAELILALLEKIKQTGWKVEYGGIFHATGTGGTTWYEFTEFLLSEQKKQKRPIPTLHPVTTDQYPTPAKRPADSRLNCDKLQNIFHLSLPPWQESCALTVLEILASQDHSEEEPNVQNH